MVDPRLVTRCWVTSKRFGPAVLVEIREDGYLLRYRARHLATRETLWILNADRQVDFLRPSDEESLHVLGLKGLYGLGEGRSDPRMP